MEDTGEMSASISQQRVRRATLVRERRAAHRRQRAAGYRGWRHLAVVVAVSLLPAVAALWVVGPWGWREAIGAAGAVLVGCSVVYFAHRYPMHRRTRGVELAYDLHSGCHHMSFCEGETEISGIDDLDMVLLPATYAAGLCAVGVPLLALPWVVLGVDAAVVFAAVSWLYYASYELVHLASHGKVGGWLDSVPGLGWLLRHHRRHHAWEVMHKGNFSMLIPAWDVVLGTLVRERRVRERRVR